VRKSPGAASSRRAVPPAAFAENDRVTIATETLAEIALDGKAGVLGANDAARSSFTVRAGDSLVALSSDLEVLGRWPIDPQHRGHHATCLNRGLALISGPDEVRLLDHTDRALWRYPHPPWTWRRGFASGCTWFDEAGQSYAVVPAASYDHCLVVCLDLESGQPLAAKPSGPGPRAYPRYITRMAGLACPKEKARRRPPFHHHKIG